MSEIVSASERGGDKGIGEPHAPDVQLLIPDDDVADPEVSIVVPAVNEEITISEFVVWCQAGLRDAGVAVKYSSSTARTTAPPNWLWREAPECCVHRNEALDAPIMTPARTSADDMC